MVKTVAKTESFIYEPRAGQFRNTANGQFVDQKKLLSLVGAEQRKLQARLKGHARLLNSEQINIPEFQIRMADSIKKAHLRMAELAVGGRKRMTPALFGSVGNMLKGEYKYLANFGQKLSEGMTDKQILSRSEKYARAVQITFSKGWIYSSTLAGYDLFIRTVDAGAAHCRSCPLYDTKGKAVPVAEIVPTGVACECRNNCKCRITRKKSGKTSLNLNRSGLEGFS